MMVASIKINMIYYVVLHYGAVGKTIRCVDSLLRQVKIPGVSSEIIVVQNGYIPKDSEPLVKRYGVCDCVTLLESVENLGFSGGNNLGYDFIKQQSADGCRGSLAVFLNNDTEIVNPTFAAELVCEYENAPFDVLSPDVFDPSVKQHQSPLCNGPDIDTYAFEESQKARDLIDESWPISLYHSLKNRAVACFGITALGRALIAKRRVETTPSAEWEKPLDDVVPQGSAVVFGPPYLTKSAAAFDECTFMYFEECILKKKCERLGLEIRYLPKLQVLHHHNEITRESLFANTFEKRRKHAQLTLDAYQRFLDY